MCVREQQLKRNKQQYKNSQFAGIHVYVYNSPTRQNTILSEIVNRKMKEQQTYQANGYKYMHKILCALKNSPTHREDLVTMEILFNKREKNLYPFRRPQMLLSLHPCFAFDLWCVRFIRSSHIAFIAAYAYGCIFMHFWTQWECGAVLCNCMRALRVYVCLHVCACVILRFVMLSSPHSYGPSDKTCIYVYTYYTWLDTLSVELFMICVHCTFNPHDVSSFCFYIMDSLQLSIFSNSMANEEITLFPKFDLTDFGTSFSN